MYLLISKKHVRPDGQEPRDQYSCAVRDTLFPDSKYWANIYRRDVATLVEEMIVLLTRKKDIGIPIFEHIIPRSDRKTIVKALDGYNQELLAEQYDKQETKPVVADDENPDDFEVFDEGLLKLLRDEE